MMSKEEKRQGIMDLRKKHKLTQEQLAFSLYGVKKERIADWERGRRTCPDLTYWAMILTHDHRDLWVEEHVNEPSPANRT